MTQVNKQFCELGGGSHTSWPTMLAHAHSPLHKSIHFYHIYTAEGTTLNPILQKLQVGTSSHNANNTGAVRDYSSGVSCTIKTSFQGVYRHIFATTFLVKNVHEQACTPCPLSYCITCRSSLPVLSVCFLWHPYIPHLFICIIYYNITVELP